MFARYVQERVIQRNNDLDLAYLEAQKLVFVGPATIQQSTLHHCNTIIYVYFYIYVMQHQLAISPLCQITRYTQFLLLSFMHSFDHSFTFTLSLTLFLSLPFSLITLSLFHSLLFYSSFLSLSLALISFSLAQRKSHFACDFVIGQRKIQSVYVFTYGHLIGGNPSKRKKSKWSLPTSFNYRVRGE